MPNSVDFLMGFEYRRLLKNKIKKSWQLELSYNVVENLVENSTGFDKNLSSLNTFIRGKTNKTKQLLNY